DVVETLKVLKKEDGPNLLTQGSTDFLQTLFRHGLVDEMYVSVFPVILGGGKRLFSDGGAPVTMKLLSSKTSGSGIVVNRYVTAGPVVTGSFEFDQPTEAELERRRKLS
ncbi:MAG TPA: dihydrofolate reductase family protein, partial [Pseudorhizobium sp.]|nr:dihydrofolate reductase family protein [Pseudorhizobium sp.]